MIDVGRPSPVVLFLFFQNTASNKSLTEMPKDLVKDAVTVRKSLLGYMGDKQMSFPETLAQNILMKGLDKPKIRDEVSERVVFVIRPKKKLSTYLVLFFIFRFSFFFGDRKTAPKYGFVINVLCVLADHEAAAEQPTPLPTSLFVSAIFYANGTPHFFQ